MDEEVTLPDGPEGASFARRAMAREPLEGRLVSARLTLLSQDQSVQPLASASVYRS